MPELDADLLADFLAIGGRLLLLKSRALLLTEESDPVVEESAAELEQRLAEYRIFRAAAEHLAAIEARGRRTYPTTREAALGNPEPPPLAPIAPAALSAAWHRMLQGAPSRPAVELPRPTRASVDERRTWIVNALRSRASLAFSEFAGTSVDEVVAAFLAVLELYRRGHIQLEQPMPFGELTVTTPVSA
jgi:segregation and condensation protein A